MIDTPNKLIYKQRFAKGVFNINIQLPSSS